jgi:molecular chaperone DnaK
VSAKDRDTGAEQKITITESGNLDRSDVERMLAEAEQHRSEDQQIRQHIDARNELDAVAYQVERTLNELGDAAPPHEKARAELLIGDAREAVKGEAPIDRLRSLTGELQQIAQSLSAARSQPGGPPPGQSNGQGPGQGSGPGQAQGGASSGDDDVIDADFTPSG